MNFPSIAFALFFAAVFLLYWFVFNSRLRLQNAFLLLAGYFFYGWFSWRYALLLLLVSLFNYFLALGLQRCAAGAGKRMLLISGLLFNIGTLAYCKYLGFFSGALRSLFSWVGLRVDWVTAAVVLPLGVSIYIFLAISYLVDVYQGKLAAAGRPVDVLLAFSFFPIIAAGPIQRPSGLLPQIGRPRTFRYARAADGARQVLWGLFMKVVIADPCAVHVDAIFSGSSARPGSALALGLFLFSLQIYADFAGYSNMAIGIGKLLGFDIMKNFNYPYFSRDIGQFWRRWNISLTSWFRDYVFLPLAYALSRRIRADRVWGMRAEIPIYVFGITLTWMLTGFWHGANVTFIAWGLLHGFFLVLHRVGAPPRKRLLKTLGIGREHAGLAVVKTVFTFFMVMLAWTFFRAPDVGQAWRTIAGMASLSLFHSPRLPSLPGLPATAIWIAVFMTGEWLGRNEEHALARLGSRWPRACRWALYYALLLAVLWFTGDGREFIYFQF
jgi:alginate O-acetyltransferase complex protein AlgI